MVDLDCKANIGSSDMQEKSPKLSDKLRVSIPPTSRAGGEFSPASSSSSSSSSSESARAAYEHYLRLPELRELWSSKQFPNWNNESILKPALQGLEITFRFVSSVMSDPRPYANRREWRRRLESLATTQIQLIAILCEYEEEDSDTRGTAPIVDLSSEEGVLTRVGSSAAEVWKLSEETTVVNWTSEASLLPRLASWQKSEAIAQKILYSIECAMRPCRYTLGLGEPNLAGKPCLQYDAVCNPSKLHALKKSPSDRMNLRNQENQTVYTSHQILESWIRVSRELLSRICHRIEARSFERAASDCWCVERIWKLLAEIQDVHLLMDPDDFLRLKNQLSIKAGSDSQAFCFGSEGLLAIAHMSKDLKHRVPYILEVEADPRGGPRIQEAAMKLYREKRGSEYDKIHLLQGLQAVESALKRFFYAYRQVLVVAMGSLEAQGNRALVNPDACDALSQIFLEPTYFPSLDAAKTFLGDLWEHQHGHVTRRRRD